MQRAKTWSISVPIVARARGVEKPAARFAVERVQLLPQNDISKTKIEGSLAFAMPTDCTSPTVHDDRGSIKITVSAMHASRNASLCVFGLLRCLETLPEIIGRRISITSYQKKLESAHVLRRTVYMRLIPTREHEKIYEGKKI